MYCHKYSSFHFSLCVDEPEAGAAEVSTSAATPLRHSLVGPNRTAELSVTPVQTWDSTTSSTRTRKTGSVGQEFTGEGGNRAVYLLQSDPLCETVSAAIACVNSKLSAATAVLQQRPVNDHRDVQTAAMMVQSLAQALTSLLEAQRHCGPAN